MYEDKKCRISIGNLISDTCFTNEYQFSFGLHTNFMQPSGSWAKYVRLGEIGGVLYGI